MKDKNYSSPILIGEVMVSREVTDQFFACDIAKCKGACCIEGDLGAPLENGERQVLEDIYPVVEPYLRPEGRQAIEAQGTWVKDFTGDYSTPLVDGAECAYVTFSESGIALCGIEQAHIDGKIPFKKPISCHLYPIRITENDFMQAVNYDRWDICDPACELGKIGQVRIYQFLKEAITRKYGTAFYEQLDAVVKAMSEGENE